METLIYILIGFGILINGMSVVGLIRFPDIYTRLHAATKTSTFGSILIVTGVVINNFMIGDQASTTIIIHSTLALLVIIFTNPISAHAIARAALLSGIKPFGVTRNEYQDKIKEASKK